MVSVPLTNCSTLAPFSPACLSQGIGHAASAAASSVVNEVSRSFAQSAISCLQNLMTFWAKIPTAGVNNESGSDPTFFMQWHLAWLVTWVAVLGLLLAAGKTAWQRRGEPFREAFSGMITMVLAIFAAAGAVNLVIQAGDAYSNWILVNSAGGPPTKVIGDKASTLFLIGGAANAQGVVLIVALLAIMASVAQMAMMIVRGAMLVLLVGVLPLAAAASISSGGKAWFRKLLGWLIAYLLYKPVAATIYAVAFFALRQGTPMDQLQGMIMIILAVAALPALMRFVVPMVSAAGGSGGGGAMAALGGAAAMGARMVPAMGGGGGGGGGGAPKGGKSSTSTSGAKTTGPGKQPEQAPPKGNPAPGNPDKTTTPAAAGTKATTGPVSTGATAGAGPLHAAKQGYDMAKKTAQGAAQDATGGGDKGGPSGS